MFAAHCTTANAGVLLSESSMLALRRTPTHIEVDLECHCGERLTVVVDRSPRQRPLVAA